MGIGIGRDHGKGLAGKGKCIQLIFYISLLGYLDGAFARATQ